MKLYKLSINGSTYETQVVRIENSVAEVLVNGTKYKVTVENEIFQSKTPKLVQGLAVPSTDADPSTAKTANPNASKGTGTIKSPLPGVVLNLFVKEGDFVKLGQKLLILEAMKMENNIEADKEGVIKSVKKQKGDSVMEGDVLIEIGN